MSHRRRHPAQDMGRTGDSILYGTSIMVDATAKAHADLDDWDGHHLWTVVAVFRVANPARTTHHLDLENLITVEGPGCVHCEQVWRPDIGAHCPGEPKDQQ